MNGTKRMRTKISGALAAMILAISTVTAVTAAPAAGATFEGWTFDYSVNATNFDGLSLNNVSYNGEQILERISMPAMNVFYDNNACGPYVDRLGGSRYDGPFSQQFTQNGVRWMSIGITDQIGSYVITQMFYLSENGELDAHVFSKGLQCNIRHDHRPFWRMDFAIGGDANDVVKRRTSGGMTNMTSEFSLAATAATGHDWEVHDTVTGDYVTIDFDDGSFDVGGEVVPETNYVNNRVFGRQYVSSEQRWQGGATFGLFGDNGQSINDLVLWYSGYMPHSPAEGPDLWHSTGFRLTVNSGQQSPGAIGDRVTDAGGSGVGGVGIDLFSEGRASFLDSTTTNSNGDYSFAVDPGCYVVTFIAPANSSFAQGSQYLNRDVCIDSGEVDNSIDAQVIFDGQGTASIGDQVVDGGGQGVGGVQIDLFNSDQAGNRLGYLRTTTTDGNGNYQFDVASAGCYTVTFIAPNGLTFQSSGTGWLNSFVCVSAGESVTNVDAVLSGGAGGASIGNRVTNQGGGGASGVSVDLFAANGDGSRSNYLRSDTTDGNGNYGFDVAAGCYVVTFVAPSGRSFVATGTAWQESYVCVTAGQTDNSVDAVLN